MSEKNYVSSIDLLADELEGNAQSFDDGMDEMNLNPFDDSDEGVDFTGEEESSESDHTVNSDLYENADETDETESEENHESDTTSRNADIEDMKDDTSDSSRDSTAAGGRDFIEPQRRIFAGKDSIGLKLLILLADLDTAWKKDLNIYLLSFVTNSGATKIWNRLKDNRLIDIFDDRTGRVTVRITRSGLAYLAEYEDTPDHRYLRMFSNHKRPSFTSSSSEKTYIAGMKLQTARIMFASCYIPVFPREKPSLKNLFLNLCDEVTKDRIVTSMKRTAGNENPEYESDRLGYKEMDADQCREMMKYGVFYTDDEFRQGIQELNYGDHLAISGSRFIGVYFSNSQYFPVYAVHGAKRMRLSKAVESKMLNMVYSFAAEISGYNTLRKLDFEYTATGDPTGRIIVITSGTGLIKTMVTGSPFGKSEYGAVNDYLLEQGFDVKKAPVIADSLFSSDKTETAKRLSSLSSSARENRAKLLLQHDNELFTRIFAVESNSQGITSLYWLLTTPPEEYRSEYLRISSLPAFANSIETDKSNPNEEFCYRINVRSQDGNGIETLKIIYLRIYDINVLTALRIGYHEKGERYMIVTRPELAGYISAMIGGRCVYISQRDSSVITDVPEYDINGYTESQAARKRETIEKRYRPRIEQTRIRQKVDELKQQKNSLPPDDRKGRKAFNDEIRELQKQLDTRKKSVKVQIELDPEMHDTLQKVADREGRAMKYILKGIVMKALDEYEKGN